MTEADRRWIADREACRCRKRGMLIVNPVSGTRSKEGVMERVGHRLGREGIAVTAVSTLHGGHARELARLAVADGFDLVVSAGGDGTVNEIAGALAHTPVVLGLLPYGSGNGLARTLGIPQDVDAALEVIARGHVVESDRGLVNGVPFTCTFGVGFDAAVSEKFAASKRRGRITYVRNVVREFLSYRSQPYAIAVDGNVVTERAFLIAVCNASQYGNNAYIAPQAKLTDGLLDLIVVHDANPLQTMRLGVDLITGTIDRNTRIDAFRVSRATITRLDGGAVHVDGEPLTMGRRLDISCDAGSLKLYAPEKREEFRPVISPLRSLIEDLRYDVLARFK